MRYGAHAIGLLFSLFLTTTGTAQTIGETLLELGGAFDDGPRNTGLTVFPALTIPSGGKYLSMATAYTAVADDISFFEANPAASSRLDNTMAALSHNNVIADANLETLGFNHRIDDFGMGLSTRFLHVPFTEYSIEGDQGESFRYLEFIGVANTSYNFFHSHRFHGLSAGINIKIANRSIPTSIEPDQSAFAIMTDMGLLTGFNFLKPFSSRRPNLTFGAVVKNIGTPARGEPLPSEAVFGIAYSPLSPLLFSADVGIPFVLFDDAPAAAPRFATGASVTVTDFLSLQTGFGLRNANPLFTLGSTILLADIALHLNYSLDATTQFDTVDRFSVQVAINLGDGGRSARRDRVERGYLEAASAFVAGDLQETIRLTERLLAVDPSFKPARDLLTLAQELADSLSALESIRVGENFFEQYIELPE